tara:strand:- start:175 stop:1332 length:1158 start_codon:yes stop_codon:yes gene_type:complete
MKKRFIFFTILIIFFPLTIILWLHFGIIISSEILRFNKSDIQTFDPNKCYKHSCIKGYERYKWAKKFYFEYDSIPYEFTGYTLFKKRKYNGEFLNIVGDDNIRLTNLSEKFDKNLKAYIFGGSVAWGYGVKDDLTFASLFAEKYKIKTFNYAQIGWNSSQNLIELTRLISRDEKLDIVIFFEGYNDAVSLCNKNQNENYFSSGLEELYNDKIYDRMRPDSFENFFSVFRKLVNVIKYKFIKDYHDKKANENLIKNTYDCHTNLKKTEKAVDHLINNWLQAKTLVENNGGKFFVILQPVSFFDNTKTDHVLEFSKIQNKDPSFSKSIVSFYNLVGKKLNDKYFFLDLKDVFNNKFEYIYVDLSTHLFPEGYREIINAFDTKFKNEF